MIRMALDGLLEVNGLQFDIPNRRLEVILSGNLKSIEEKLSSLKLGAALISVEEHNAVIDSTNVEADSKSRLMIVLGINFSFFLIEVVFGIFSQSMGLVADSLDMLADSLVYGLSLYAINHIKSKQRKIAKLSGYFQILLATFGMFEVARRFVSVAVIPDFFTMAGISAFALLANFISLLILAKTKDQGVHLKASWIFTSHDILANIGVIIAATLIYFTSSKLPDLIVGSFIFILVMIGALRILRMVRSAANGD